MAAREPAAGASERYASCLGATMKNRCGMILFVGTLASAFLMGACGDEEEATCTDVCERLEAYGEDVVPNCVEECKASHDSSETLECMSELPCDASEAKLSECLKKTEVSSGCKTYCSKPCVLEELEREACEVLCMASANPEQQACLADIDGETCEGQEDCVQLVVIVE